MLAVGRLAASLAKCSGGQNADAMADAVDAAELLDVDMGELAWSVALIADHRRLGRQGFRAGRRPSRWRRSTTPMLETGRPMRWAIAGLLRRWWRRATISTSVVATSGVGCG